MKLNSFDLLEEDFDDSRLSGRGKEREPRVVVQFERLNGGPCGQCFWDV